MNTKRLLGAMVVFLFGYTSTYITSSWRAKNVPAQYYKKILVIGIMSGTIRDMRQNLVFDQQGTISPFVNTSQTPIHTGF